MLYLEEELEAAKPSPAEHAAAEGTLELAGSGLLYARVDVIAGAVLELELAEPSLYLGFGEGAAEGFAAAIAAALSR